MPEPVPERPPPLTGADVGFIKIVDFDKQQKDERKSKGDMKIRFY